MTRLALLSFALAAVSLISGTSAWADQVYPSLQLVCTPKLLHFSLTTLDFDNLDPAKVQHSQELTIEPIWTLIKHPYKCAWKGGAITATVTYYHEAQPRGYCGGVEYANFDVAWNGKSLGKIERDPCGGDRQSFTLDEMSEFKPRTFNITHCTDSSGQVTEGPSKDDCKTYSFEPETGKVTQ
jgi:hypothetical protein